MDSFNESAELLCTMSPKIKHKLKPGQKQFRRVAGASILALKKNIRRSSLYEKSMPTIDNCDLNLESTDSTESCDSEKWNLKIMNETPIIISDTETDSESEPSEKQEPNTVNLHNYSLPDDKVNDIACWLEKVTAEKEEKDTTTYTELSTIYGSETGENFLAKEKGPVVNSTFLSTDCKRFDELFRTKYRNLNVSNNDSLGSGDNEDVVTSSKDLVIDDSFERQNESLTTRLEKTVKVKNGSKVNENNVSETPPQTTIGESEDLEVMLDKLYGNSWRQKQELILPKTEPRKKVTKPRMADILYSERKPKRPLFKKGNEEDDELNSNNLKQNVRLKANAHSTLYSKLKVLCDSDTNSENSPIKACPKTRLDFGDESSDETTNDPKTSKYFQKKPVLQKDTKKDDLPNENFDSSDLGQSLEERIRKKINNIKVPSVESKPLNKISKTPKKTLTSNKENTPIMEFPQFLNMRATRPSLTSSTSNSDEETSQPRFITQTKRKADKPTVNIDVSISSDDEWDQEVSKLNHKKEIRNGTYSFLASLSGDIPLSKCDMSARIYRNNFKTFKDELLSKLFKMFNEHVFDNALSPDMLIEWSDRMTRTAGFCYCKKITRRTGLVERSARVVLSTKVVDSAERMRDTLIHELCHAATWIVDCVSGHHGSFWKSCIGRHTKSLDVERKRCGYCYGKFEVLINKTTKKGETKSVPATPKKEASGFALFVKENYGAYKTPNLKHGDVMKLLGQKFQQLKVNQT
ncbi:uncharacterized protein isoform X2 [Leptinotarsa decemlineata]|uniref:uncharacterized protein isoform X2 n=1 Tax=Leptinotarsa decemlineata TaxID=7539 RepID=UPI003D309542